MTLGGAGTAGVRIIVWCKSCSHQTEPDPTAMAAPYGAETPGGRAERAAGSARNAAAGIPIWWWPGPLDEMKAR